MKRPLLTLSILFAFVPFIGIAQYTIETDNIRARTEENGMLFWNSTTSNGSFEAPIDSNLHTFYAFNFWVSGVSPAGNAYAYGTRYFQLTSADLRFGPIMDEDYYETENDIWERVWNITSLQIEEHIIGYDQPNYMMPEVIENWPAHGDPSKGQALNLAPFVDTDANGIYEPSLGDYPKIMGNQAIYGIYNGERSNELMSSMGIETHVMTYAITNDITFENTIFAYVKHYNRSTISYGDAYLGYFSDFDIGEYSDDLTGTDVERSTVYGANGDVVDEDYGSNTPIQGVTLLRGVKQDDDFGDNPVGINELESINGSGFGDGIIDNEYRGLDFSISVSNDPGAMGDPVNTLGYYYTMRGIWKDGTQQTYGGSGYNTDSTAIGSRFFNPTNDPALYGTYGADTDGLEWGPFVPHDVRIIGSSGPFTFDALSCRDMYFAFVFDRTNEDFTEKLISFQESVDEVVLAFEPEMQEDCSTQILGIEEEKRRLESSFSSFPNPFNEHINLRYEGEDQNAFIEIYDLMGKRVYTSKILPGLQQIDLSHLEGHSFMLRLIDHNGVSTQKIVKM